MVSLPNSASLPVRAQVVPKIRMVREVVHGIRLGKREGRARGQNYSSPGFNVKARIEAGLTLVAPTASRPYSAQH